MARKGITPIISVVILLLITIALAGAAWTFLQGVLLAQISNAFSVPTGGAFCTEGSGSNGGTINVYALNIGTSPLKKSDFVITSITNTNDDIISIDNTSATESDVDQVLAGGFTSISPQKSSQLIGYTCTGAAGCPSGGYTVILGTNSGTQQFQVVCA